MHLSIYSIKNTLFEGEIKKVIACTPQGQITVLDNHIPLIAKIMGPLVRAVHADSSIREISLESGIMEVRPESEVLILAESS